ncbi:bifunctional phosphopantothenoylcysteine decarboxylase/phosphopantothenate--cysteine ligase CoaBC [Lichenihabitans sp. Uapishka_5]|uniref:bifunctional phosphopantothenoylcysteine decarboxylase/phosphopantothenate--cysteine ligase CoaBC n=1 Tax=Lichenihabitans sp. Uapishka_5 TaxID=3037302 RepID=UPI0029E7FB56|nr:bifunctional phosphopantothenoylcysteine decarboxylase/phosphopantothenate--cysteine ligase CoaBC [Lichenihabitans sp. Uapishka_5]MDX7950117.1 bifunctional phosphopantothenoylcysteine decarboxylase/phosphopantothenate--cysteine ligase CoaBC [Lichenihabitans sp. Uapishka_5]
MVGQSLAGRSILLVIGGGIAAYKALDLIRRLRERGARIRPVMTEGAKAFVTPLSVASLAGAEVHQDLFSLTAEAAMGHIELSRAADLVVVAPATANLMAKLAQGLADDLPSTLLLATDKRILLAPAMNLRMWLHPATQRNLATLHQDGVRTVGPDDGSMACGEFGPGRMAEPLAIVAAVEAALAEGTTLPLPPWVAALQPGGDAPLRGRRVVVTSGPTYEPIDPIRFIANRSSGRQGHSIAAAAARAGAAVTLVSGPVAIPDPAGVRVVKVETAREMLAAVDQALPCDLFVATAAVADWRPATVATGKIKKRTGDDAPALALVENPDILATVGRRAGDRPTLVVGFAAETDRLLDHATEKLARKGCDVIVANNVGGDAGVMGGDHNAVTILTRDGQDAWPRMSKTAVAERLIRLCADRLDKEAP